MNDVDLLLPMSLLPRIGGMATMPSRIDSLRVALTHILPQLDRLYLYLDKHDKVPQEFADNPKIVTLLPKDQSTSLGCSGKFFGLGLYRDPCLYFCFDDDVIYREGYVQHLACALRRHHFRVIVGVHGSVYRMTVNSYMKDRRVLHFMKGLDFDVLVDGLGTGTIAFHSSCIQIDADQWRIPNASDLLFMIEAIRQKIPRICVRRPVDFIVPIAQCQSDSICMHSLSDDSLQTEMIREAIRCYPNAWCMSSS